MNKQSKEGVVSNIRERMLKSNAIFIVEYKGLKVGELTNLRRELMKEKNGDLKIVKNTLLLLAAKGVLPEIEENIFTGPTAIVCGYGMPNLVAKQIVGFSKNNPLLVIKGGIIYDNFVSADKIVLLSTLPDKEALMGILINILNTPISRFVYTIASPLSGLITVLNGIIQNKQTKN